MKKFGKIVSVGLSLALCAGMVMPAFAARVLNNDEIEWTHPTERPGYTEADGCKVGRLKGYEEDGQTKYDYYLENDLVLEGSLVIGVDSNLKPIQASIDLNGYDLILNEHLDLEQQSGTAVPKAEKQGSVIQVDSNSKLEVFGNKEGEKDYARGEGEGSITGGTGSGGWWDGWWLPPQYDQMESCVENQNHQGCGGGVKVHYGTFVMTGGKITGNLSTGHGGGVSNWEGTVTLNDVEISNNRSWCHGGGIYSYGGTNTLNGCTVEENRAAGFGGCADLNGGATLNITESVIKNNKQVGDTNSISREDNKSSITKDIKTSICGNTRAYGYETSDRHHVWETVVDTPSTCKTHGTGHKVCKSGCAWNGAEADGVVELPLDPSNHTGKTEIRNAKAPTATEDGYTGDIHCADCGVLIEKGTAIPASGPNVFPDYDFGGGTTTIEDEAVPLAGLFTRADAIGYLWQQSGEPEAELSTFEDVPEDHQWAVAIGWAQDVGIAVADQEGNFRPDDLVLRWVEDHEAEPEGEFEEFLNRYAEFAGIELDADELFVELGGEPEDIIMGEDAQVIFDDFFAKLEQALEELAA